MSFPFRYQVRFKDYLEARPPHKIISVFCKSLYLFLCVKIVFLWPVMHDLVAFFPPEFPSLMGRAVYAPLMLASFNLNLFMSVVFLVSALGLVVRLNYFTAIIICWLSFCLNRLALPIAGGPEQVLNLFLLMSIFLPSSPRPGNDSLRSYQTILVNFVFLLCRMQLMLIYLLSGFDKLMSQAWRSGEAVFSIVNLEFYFTPIVTLHFSDWIFKGLAWSVIIFELTMPVLIWFRKLRFPLLLLLIAFHLIIAFFLSLPDFGILMILTSILFLPENLVNSVIRRFDNSEIR
jgi:hypothetical protein